MSNAANKLKIKKILNYFLVVFSIGILHLIVFPLYGLTYSKPPECSGTDPKRLLVILGNTVYPDGRLSPVLQYRIEKGYEAFQTGCYDKLITSGGLGKEGHNEGTAMANYLIRKGIAPSSIIIDNEGLNSHLTAVNSKRIADELGIQSVTVVTSYYHVLRSMLAMKQEGFESVKGIGSTYLAFQDVIKIPRDIVGFYVYLFRY